ncbi:MAG: GTP 3',8-cyclase MoaA, partial [Nitrospirota bacterium]
VERLGLLKPVKMKKSGPAKYFRFDGAPGIVGFISPISHRFCGECNRLRLTADGKLRPCLLSETEIDLKPALRSGAPDEEIERLIKLSIEVKPKGHHVRMGKDERRIQIKDKKDYRRPMSSIGG